MSDNGSEHPTAVGHGGERVTVSLDAPQFQVAARRPRRVEKATALLFLGALVAFGAFGAAFILGASDMVLGIIMAAGMLAFGVAFAAWGKYLMPKGPFEEARAPMQTTEEEKQLLIADFASRGKVAIERRGFLGKVMGAAGAVFGVVALFPLVRSLGPKPGTSLDTTAWKKGAYLTDITGRRLTASDINVGGFVTCFPENDVGGAMSQTVLLHPQTTDIVTRAGRETWAPKGYIAFSKVCTHAGCPVGLYEQATEQLLCPCHQSLFDIYSGCEPVFGPAPRPLPQLPLYIDSKGYIRAQAPYDEPVGPGFWTRGGTT